MVQTYRTLRDAESDEGVLGVVTHAPPMNVGGYRVSPQFRSAGGSR